ncbi:MAG: MoxR family ATPase [Candidatus Omnitrophica bacterium]|nr:MoxR family ATPase [Candidatus Omnitrophota bacterium]MCK5082653.1 MoxR family ATPase [Candidatus Omnitrophota bacterium]
MSLIHSQTNSQMQSIIANLSKVIQGKEDKIELLVLALVAGGHILIEDIPGVGKTTLARSLAKSIDGKFSRIQFTPDLLPTDITGINFYQQSEGKFIFKPGPVFSNILLADEINRASARTQSALLEAMSEEHVTIDGEPHFLPQPFIVLATQNPIEYHGTYPLPEAQLDRFMLQIDIGYPPLEIEQSLAINRSSQDPVDTIEKVISLEELDTLRASVDHVKIESSISQYLLQIVLATRNHPNIRLGVSTRGTLLYARIVRALAILEGRDFVIPEDVKKLAIPVISHRILLNTKAQYSGITAPNIVREILDAERVPR